MTAEVAYMGAAPTRHGFSAASMMTEGNA